MTSPLPEGILLVDKPPGKTAFNLVSSLRKHLRVRKIGHAGTLDPFATGVMVMLIGRKFTRLSDTFLCQDKEYIAHIHLGTATDTHDCDGKATFTSDHVPTPAELEEALTHFQGEVSQIPPMFSAKKVGGKKLYELARKGQEIERKPVKIHLQTHLLHYHYPDVHLKIACSKGTYIRTIAHDLGKMLTCGAYVKTLQRTRSGNFQIEDCFDGHKLFEQNLDLEGLKRALSAHEDS